MYDPSKPYKKQLLELIQQTWQTPYMKVEPGLYPRFTKTFSGWEIDHTDGIGTKGWYHWRQKTFQAAVLDALAMNLNDLAMARAVPYKLQNHIVLPADDHKAIMNIVAALVEECIKRQIVMTGGETSIHNDAPSMDIGLTMSGIIQDDKPNRIMPGDVLLGLPSSGLHSNGFTLVRKVFGDEVRPEFTVPTAIYSDAILPILKDHDVHGMMHITGGAFTKLKDIAPHVDIEITNNHALKPQPIFMEMHTKGVSDEDMYRTFNCGIGFVLAVLEKDVSQVLSATGAVPIGRAISGSGRIMIDSQLSPARIEM